MPIKKGREYRALQDFSLIPREGENDAYRVRGTAVVFDSPTCLYEYDGVKYYEVIDRHAFDGCDMSCTAAGRVLYEEIDGGYIDKMSFSFSVRESKYDNVTHTRTITKIRKLYDVSAVDIPAYEETSLSARSFFEVEHSKEVKVLEQAARRRRLLARTRTYSHTDE